MLPLNSGHHPHQGKGSRQCTIPLNHLFTITISSVRIPFGSVSSQLTMGWQIIEKLMERWSCRIQCRFTGMAVDALECLNMPPSTPASCLSDKHHTIKHHALSGFGYWNPREQPEFRIQYQVHLWLPSRMSEGLLHRTMWDLMALLGTIPRQRNALLGVVDYAERSNYGRDPYNATSNLKAMVINQA